jgi:colanic acid/amylovoran biosynthesis glycosyltransferase
MRTVAIYKRDLLAFSETFIVEQGEALSAFSPHYIGLYSIKGLALPADRRTVLTESPHSRSGRARLVAYKAFHRDRRFFDEIKEIDPVLIHAHFESGGIDAMPLAQALRIPLVVTCHGADVTIQDKRRSSNPFARKLYAARRKRLRAGASLFIAVSEFIRGKMLDRGYSDEKIAVHYIGVDTSKFTPGSSARREPVVLFVGRLVEKKGCEYLIRAMSAIQEHVPNAELIIIGDGPLRSSLETLAHAQVRNCRFLGVQPPDSVRDWMGRARVLAQPSVTGADGDSEGLPIVILEALSMGLPVVASDHAGIPEAVIPEQTGLLSRERDVDSLAGNLRTLLTNDRLWEHMVSNARHRATTMFDLASQTRKLEDIYRSILAKQTRCHPLTNFAGLR